MNDTDEDQEVGAGASPEIALLWKQVGRIGHDFSNVLQAIISHAEQLGEIGYDPTHIQQLVENVLGAASEGAQLARELQCLAHKLQEKAEVSDEPTSEASVHIRPIQRRLARPASILLAEDLEMNQELIRYLLEKDGHAVDIVSDGAAAVAAVQGRGYDLVLMDIEMPGMDGVTATKKLRALGPPACDIPIIALTANVMPQQVRRFKEAGISDHLGKPVSGKDLSQKLSEWLPERDVLRVPVRVDGICEEGPRDKPISAQVAEHAAGAALEHSACFSPDRSDR
jgi:CheY-like chemotaxis protein